MAVNWQKQYNNKSTPWNYNFLDEDFKNFFEKQNKNKTIIDLGCGNGSQSYFLEKMGFKVKAIDIVKQLKYKVKDFLIDDILQSNLNEKFDFIIDRGLIHNLFPLTNSKNYFNTIDNISKKNSILLLKVLSPYEIRYHPNVLGQSGPYRFNEEQLKTLYDNYKLVEIKDTYYYSQIKPYLRSYMCVYKCYK